MDVGDGGIVVAVLVLIGILVFVVVGSIACGTDGDEHALMMNRKTSNIARRMLELYSLANVSNVRKAFHSVLLCAFRCDEARSENSWR